MAVAAIDAADLPDPSMLILAETIDVSVREYVRSASVTFTTDAGSTVSIEFIRGADGASMADDLMLAMRDACRIDARQTEMAP